MKYTSLFVAVSSVVGCLQAVGQEVLIAIGFPPVCIALIFIFGKSVSIPQKFAICGMAYVTNLYGWMKNIAAECLGI